MDGILVPGQIGRFRGGVGAVDMRVCWGTKAASYSTGTLMSVCDESDAAIPSALVRESREQLIVDSPGNINWAPKPIHHLSKSVNVPR